MKKISFLYINNSPTYSKTDIHEYAFFFLHLFLLSYTLSLLCACTFHREREKKKNTVRTHKNTNVYSYTNVYSRTLMHTGINTNYRMYTHKPKVHNAYM